MTALYFDVLAQNYSCLRIVSYFSGKILLRALIHKLTKVKRGGGPLSKKPRFPRFYRFLRFSWFLRFFAIFGPDFQKRADSGNRLRDRAQKVAKTERGGSGEIARLRLRIGKMQKNGPEFARYKR